MLEHCDTIFNYTDTVFFFYNPPLFHSVHRVKGNSEMNQCSAVNEPIVCCSLASLAAQLRRCPVNEAKGCRKRIVHPVLSVPPKSMSTITPLNTAIAVLMHNKPNLMSSV